MDGIKHDVGHQVEGRNAGCGGNWSETSNVNVGTYLDEEAEAECDI